MILRLLVEGGVSSLVLVGAALAYLLKRMLEYIRTSASLADRLALHARLTARSVW